MSTSRRYITNPTMVEAYTAWNVVLFGIDLGLHYIILEGDALEVVQAFKKEDQLWQRYGCLIEDSMIILHSLQL